MQNIKYQIRYLNPDLLSWPAEEIDQLPDILMEDENLLHIIDGIYDEMAVLLLSTDSRIIMKGLGIDFIEVIPHEKMILIQYLKSQEILELCTEEKIFHLRETSPELAQQFCTTVSTFLSGDNPTEKNSDTGIFELLEQLGKLRESGILTNEEFTEQKKKLLEKL
ncbi:SHOCT domain-containing protein [Chryseobacterium arthrosphaerae]|uniref:SHOCT domain-containing protein n=1 Tax=Chryseobacterium arthrosphaerae TaxID=651561 RepID=A0A3S0QFU1_9FLAO|nr:SHOCT domain-containing protein [Chryseobacterium arthrosphaerae]